MPSRAMWLVTITVALGLVLPASSAHAVVCGAPSKPFSELSDVVFDGVLLSGPRQEPLGPLASPARMQVLRYLKGRGPRVITIGTGMRLFEVGDDPGVVLISDADIGLYPGAIWRIYGYTPKGAGASTARGVLAPHPCDGVHPLRTGRYLRGVPGSRVAQYDQDGRRWAVELLRGPPRLRCLRVHPGIDPDAHECHRARRFDDVLVALVPAGGKRFSTAVAATATDLESITVDGPSGRVEAPATGPGHVALVVVPGYAERSDVEVTARLRGGRVVPVAGFGAGVVAARGDELWGVARAAAHPPVPGVACVTYALRPDPDPPNFLTGYPSHGECGRDSGFFAVRSIDRFTDQQRPERWATIVFGIAPAGADRVVVTGPDGEREAVGPSATGVFALVYAGGVSHRDLTLEFHADGRERGRFPGLREWNVVKPPRSALDTGLGR